MKTIKIRFFDLDKDGLIQLVVNQRVTTIPNIPHRYKQAGSINIAYEPRPSPTVIATCDGKPIDALEVALECMRAFTVAQFHDWVTDNLKAQGLNDIVKAINTALDTEYKKAGVIVFWEDEK